MLFGRGYKCMELYLKKTLDLSSKLWYNKRKRPEVHYEL